LIAIPEIYGTAVTEAFLFAGAGREKHRLRYSSALDKQLQEIDGQLTTRAATTGCIFDRAKDFWSIVGWAFNCSYKYPKRWERWRIWLDNILELLEHDFRLSVGKNQDRISYENNQSESDNHLPCILSKYLSKYSQKRGDQRRIMRAIFADATSKSIAEFSEIWPNETTSNQKHGNEDDKETNVSKYSFDEYIKMMDEAEELLKQSPRVQTRQASPSKTSLFDHDVSNTGDQLDNEFSSQGDFTVLRLRKRLLSLLALHSVTYPNLFLSIGEFLDLLSEYIRPLPLSSFNALISPFEPYLHIESHSFLIQMLLKPLLSHNAPTNKTGLVDPNIFTSHYLPFPASSPSIVDNAKVSICLENLMRLLYKHADLEHDDELSTAMAKGRKARFEKVNEGNVKKSGSEAVRIYEYAKDVLQGSEERMAVLVDILYENKKKSRSIRKQVTNHVDEVQVSESKKRKR